MDESSDTSDTAQLSIFIHGVDSSLCITEELLGLKSMHGTTTGKDISGEIFKCIIEMSLGVYLWDCRLMVCLRCAVKRVDWPAGFRGRCGRKMQVSLQFVSFIRKGCVAKLSSETCCEFHNTSSQLHKSQRFESLAVLSLFWRSLF